VPLEVPFQAGKNPGGDSALFAVKGQPCKGDRFDQPTAGVHLSWLDIGERKHSNDNNG